MAGEEMMHPELLNEIVALCRRRQAQGDHPTETPASAERLENAVLQLVDTLAHMVAAERERCALAFEAEVETWDEMRKRHLLGAIKRKGAAAIRGA